MFPIHFLAWHNFFWCKRAQKKSTIKVHNIHDGVDAEGEPPAKKGQILYRVEQDGSAKVLDVTLLLN